MTNLKKRIEEAVADFFDEGECKHAPVLCGATIRNDPAHCSACLTDFALSQVLDQIRRDGEIAEQRAKDAGLQFLDSDEGIQKDYWSGRHKEAEDIMKAILAQIGET
jgi:hypothetical protein